MGRNEVQCSCVSEANHEKHVRLLIKFHLAIIIYTNFIMIEICHFYRRKNKSKQIKDSIVSKNSDLMKNFAFLSFCYRNMR